MAGIMLAIEPRLKAAVLQCPGIYAQHSMPEADEFNFLPHVTQPVLMVGGRYDSVYPLLSSQLPMLKLLGTPSASWRSCSRRRGLR